MVRWLVLSWNYQKGKQFFNFTGVLQYHLLVKYYSIIVSILNTFFCLVLLLWLPLDFCFSDKQTETELLHYI